MFFHIFKPFLFLVFVLGTGFGSFGFLDESTADENDLTPPQKLGVTGVTNQKALLALPEDGPVGYSTSNSTRKNRLPIALPTTQPDLSNEVGGGSPIRPVAGISSKEANKNATVLVNNASSSTSNNSRLAVPQLSPEDRQNSGLVPTNPPPVNVTPPRQAPQTPNTLSPTPISLRTGNTSPEAVVPMLTSTTAAAPRPVADPMALDHRNDDLEHPPVRTAAFLKVTPGVTTLRKIVELWGEPLESSVVDGQIAHLYARESLNHIEVQFRDNVVKSIVVQLETPFPEEQVRDVLKTELLKTKPVLIPDENGRIIGEVFPEKGVMFIFPPTRRGDSLLVSQIAIEQVTSEPFILRAEATMHDRPTDALRDLRNAIMVNPDDSKAFWLLAKLELTVGQAENALIRSERAIRLDERRPAYHLTLVQALIRLNRIEEARLYLEESIALCERFPHEKARALCMLGDLYRMGRAADYEKAIGYHSESIQIAMTMVDHANATLRQTAKDVLFDAHLGAAHDVAWGRWDKKDASISKWIGRAREISVDPDMVAAKRFSNEYPFKIAACVLATQVGLPEHRDIVPFIEEVIACGEELMASTNDPILQRKYQWEIGLSLYDAVQIFQLRKSYSQALKYGELAAEFMEAGIVDRRSDTDFYLLGRLYFRMGAIHAIGNKNHRAAIEWFDTAKPVFEQLLPKINPEALGRLGETMVSMGVSYWMTGQREEAIRLTERGLKQIERGIRSKTLSESALMIPYSNLANMHNEIGNTEQATRYARLASTVKQIVK